MTALALIVGIAIGLSAGWLVLRRPSRRCICPAEHVTMANCPVHGWWPNRG